jgi:hypothetical protein
LRHTGVTRLFGERPVPEDDGGDGLDDLHFGFLGPLLIQAGTEVTIPGARLRVGLARAGRRPCGEIMSACRT